MNNRNDKTAFSEIKYFFATHWVNHLLFLLSLSMWTVVLFSINSFANQPL